MRRWATRPGRSNSIAWPSWSFRSPGGSPRYRAICRGSAQAATRATCVAVRATGTSSTQPVSASQCNRRARGELRLMRRRLPSQAHPVRLVREGRHLVGLVEDLAELVGRPRHVELVEDLTEVDRLCDSPGGID